MAGSKRRSAAPARRGTAGPRKPTKRRFFDYPRQGYGGLHRWLPSWRFLLGSALSLGFLGLGALVALYVTISIPAEDAETRSQASTVYFASNEDGSLGTPMGTFAAQKRELVDLETLPDYVGNAVVSSEDRTFWENRGISITGMGRAALNNLKGGATQGASTLTQQYVERYYNLPTKSYWGKLKEAILAVKINQSVSKDEILGRYLNTIYFGRDSYGIQTAAQAYYGVDAKDLTISQAALLAGIIPSPSNWDPAVAHKKAEQRWASVLDKMVADGHITQAERDAQTFPEPVEYVRSDTLGGTNGYILDRVKAELIDKGITNDMIEKGGLQIVTTIEAPVQQAAVDAVNGLRDGTLAGEPPSESTRVSVVSIDPTDGAVLSMYGGADFITDQRNTATYDKIQAGSTYKPFTLIAALQKGISLETTYDGSSPRMMESWGKKVTNFDGHFGMIDLVTATAQSVNTVYAQLNDDVGPEATAEVAREAGITTTPDIVPSNVLGADAVHPLDVASAYATFAAQGVYNKPFLVREATYIRDGSVAYIADTTSTRVFEADVMADATFALTQVVERGSGKRYVKPLGRPIAGKTGTSTDNKSAWFVGYTPTIATAVAFSQIGTNNKDLVGIDPFGGVDQVTGGTWPAALWASYMKPVFELPKYAEKVPFPARANVGAKPTPTVTETPTTEPTVEAPAADVAVPGVEGKLQADAEAALAELGLRADVQSKASETVAKGRVISVSPGAGASVTAGSTVTLVISTGPAAPVPTAPPVPPANPQPTQSPTPTTPVAPAPGAATG
ncbi:transglycosylase domain-containing protein [Cellulomonas sp. P22]|uniref:transglycosylase domain-containing protein n=1 Tax=Cellulomonas sp. P22 TaxID=3373189 RepID=UPI0037AADACD